MRIFEDREDKALLITHQGIIAGLEREKNAT